MFSKNKYDTYPHKLFRLESCMGHKAQADFDRHQLESATKTFLYRVNAYSEAAGTKSALSVEQKEEIMPFLKMLAECGWPPEYGTAIIESRDYDVKSLSQADMAFKSIAAFLQEHGMEHRHTLHIAMHYIGEALVKAVKFNPNHKPAGSPGGGQFDFGPGNGGSPRTSPSGGGTGRPGNRSPLFTPPDHRQPAARPSLPEYSSGKSPVTPEHWNKIQDVLDNRPKISDAKIHAYSHVWAAEGGLNQDPDGSAVAGIRQATLNNVKQDPVLAAKLRNVKTPNDLKKHPELVPDIYDAYFDKNLKDIGGSSGLDKVGNKYASTAMADTVFREGPKGAGQILREAIIKTDPHFDSKIDPAPTYVGPQIFSAYSQLAKNPATLGTLLDNVAKARIKHRPYETSRPDYFRFEKERAQDRGT